MRPPFYQRIAPILVVVFLCASPILFFGAFKAIQSNSNKVLDWLPKSFEETQRLLWFVEHFGSDELLAIGWEGCDLQDERIDEFVRIARQATPISDGSDRNIFREVTSGRHVLTQLMEPPLRLPESIAKQRMRSWIIGNDSDATCIIARIQPTEDKFYDRMGAFRRVEQVAEQIGIARSDLRIAGPTADSVAIDEAGQRWTFEMGLASMLTGFCLAWTCLRKWRHVLTIFVTSLLASATSLAIVHYAGYKMDSVLMTMPALIFVLTTSGGIHLTHYLREGLSHHSATRAPYYAIKIGWLPCTLACVTTTIGLGSLAVSRVTPVIRFGLFSAVGVCICLILLLLFWPSLSQLLVKRRSTDDAHDPLHGSEWWEPLFQFSTRFYGFILAVACILIPVLGLGLARTNTSVHLKNLLPGASALLTSYAWLQSEIGPLIPVEVVLSFPADEQPTDKTMVRRAALVESLRRKIEALELSGGSVAATTFAPELPLESGARNTMLRRVVGRHMLKNRTRFVETGFLRDLDGQELWRISTRVSSDQSDYSVFLNSLETTVDTFLAEQNGGANADTSTPNETTGEPRDASTPPTVSAQICGAIPLIQMAQRQLLIDLIRSFVTAFALIGLTMVILLRRPAAGLLSMIPNVFPTLVVFGIMGLMRKSIDIGTMMTASVALGIAVDDTLHFLFWVRKSMEQGQTRILAIRSAFQKSATAVLQTSIICGLGLAPFVVSPFGPLSRFAGVMFALLMAALIGDLILLPAIVASPLGRFFAPKGSIPPTPDRTADESSAAPVTA